MGQYILSGSQQFGLMEKISQSLAGRVVLFRLLPFSFEELDLTPKGLSLDANEVMLMGGYPAIYDRQIDSADYYPSYIETYIERDVRTLINVKDLALFRTFLRLCAGRIGQVLNMQSLASDTGITVQTAKSWLTVLETSFILFTLQPYYKNFNKRVTKSPKLFFYDTGVACNLLGIRSAEQLANYYQKGSIFENMVIAELYKQGFNTGVTHPFFFWRDSNGLEVDLLIEKLEGLDVIEMKSGSTIHSELLKGVNQFSSIAGDAIHKKYLIYGGSEIQRRTDATVLGWRNISAGLDI